LELTTALLSALALALILEGLMPFVFPEAWRKTMAELIQLDTAKIRMIGLTSIGLGVILLLIFS